MFFTGDALSRKKVDLSGKSKQADRKQLLEQARIDRERRQRLRLETQSATTIQKFVRGRLTNDAQRAVLRREWQLLFGEYGEKADHRALCFESKFVPQLLFFYQSSAPGDVQRLARCCWLVLQALASPDLNASVFATRSREEEVTIRRRLNLLSLLCIQVVHQGRSEWCDELARPWEPGIGESSSIACVLLDTMVALVTTQSGQSAARIDFLGRSGLFRLCRDIALSIVASPAMPGRQSVLERAMVALCQSYVEADVAPARPSGDGDDDMASPRGSGEAGAEVDAARLRSELPLELHPGTQLLSIPFLSSLFPSLKGPVGAKLWTRGVSALATSVPEFLAVLPLDGPAPHPLPTKQALLGNIMEGAYAALKNTHASPILAAQFGSVVECLLEELPQVSTIPDEDVEEEEVVQMQVAALDPRLEEQLSNFGDAVLLRHLVRLAFPLEDEVLPSTSGRALDARWVSAGPPSAEDASVVSATCGFLYTAVSLLPRQRHRIHTGLAFSAQAVPRMWRYIKRCRETDQLWPTGNLRKPTEQLSSLPANSLGWMLPLAVFCPVYSFLLITTDKEEFYEHQKPLPLTELPQLITVLKQAVWQSLWGSIGRSTKSVGAHSLFPDTRLIREGSVGSPTGSRTFSLPAGASTPWLPLSSSALSRHISSSTSRLLAELHDRNCSQQFMPPEDFHVPELASFSLTEQVKGENSRVRELLQEAPFLLPFQERVRIYTSMIGEFKSESGTASRSVRVKIRRTQIVEDAFSQLGNLSGEVLKGSVKVTFVNELGEEEAGIDGGGLFKDFLENITKIAYNVQYGFFKETSDHLLYPNPSSHLVSVEHLDYFAFFGKILGKAMLEGILVDIPFAGFFLRKLIRKQNHLHDLPSMDPTLYRSLLFLKRYAGDVADLGMYFVVDDNEFGEQSETELIPGGKEIPVTNQNVIRYIHLVAHHRLNTQIRLQCEAFLSGLQELIQPEWLALFNSQELQMLISGSQDGWNLDDLRQNVRYSGGYSEDHYVIRMFWDVVQTFTPELQQKFLKFVTGCSRGPLLGFKHLEPPFCIHRAGSDENPDDAVDRLPTAATCLNLLKLPPYRSHEAVSNKLLYAINANAGFDLS